MKIEKFENEKARIQGIETAKQFVRNHKNMFSDYQRLKVLYNYPIAIQEDTGQFFSKNREHWIWIFNPYKGEYYIISEYKNKDKDKAIKKMYEIIQKINEV